MVDFDVLSIDIGSTPARVSVSGAAEYAIAVKPVLQLAVGIKSSKTN
ncbi:hypothetical protein [Nostoc sp.]